MIITNILDDIIFLMKNIHILLLLFTFLIINVWYPQIVNIITIFSFISLQLNYACWEINPTGYKQYMVNTTLSFILLSTTLPFSIINIIYL